MYKALIQIGEYNPGEQVPDELAEIWSKMYVVSPVEKVKDVEPKVPKPLSEEVKQKIEEKSEQEKPEDTSGNLLEDYLGRNTDVVVKNIKTDKLNKEQLKKLFELEKSSKKRSAVIRALEKRLEEKK